MGITLRNVTGSALTYNQMDENFRFLSQSYFYLSGSNVTSGSLTLTGSLNVSEGITGSLLGTSSYASNALSASYAATASYSTTLIANASNSAVGVLRFGNSANSTIVTINNLTASLAATASSVTPLNQDVVITGSLTVSASNAFTNIGNARFVGNTTFSGSVGISGSQTFNGTSISTGTQIVTGSLLTSGSNTLIGNTVLSGSVNVSGSTSFVGTHTLSGTNTITGNTVLSGSIIVSGSANFRNTTFIVTGSQFYTGSSVYVGNQTITGSLSLTSNGAGTGLFINGQKQFNYISVYHTASILPTQNVSGSFIYSTVVTSSGISVVSGSRITFANTGIYNIQFSAQVFTQTGANVYIWLKKNGTNVADSAGRVGPTANNTYNITAWNYVDTFTSGSYVEIAYQSDQTNTQFQYATATGNIPAIPSIITTVTQVA
jgi:hypothetical protein